MAASTSYNSERPQIVSGEVEYPCDPASGAFFQADYKKHNDLKQMLDGSKDSLKLEAMKRIISMIAKGRDASDLFPAVVKNVVSKNIEVKKLVYVYLVRYAEEQQDLALLSISTFQRALKDPNQLIRASALRVLSSIRVVMIVPIVMLAIRDSASDMSPYVRKTAAHAIPKIYSLDPEQKEELVCIIDKLLSDKAPLVVGSAAMAFTEVCPERSDLIHRSYRKLCALLMDVDEWGQLVLLGVLTRYARENFCDPNLAESNISDDDHSFYEDSDGCKSSEDEGEKGGKKRARRSVSSPTLDPDHKLLLRAARPLLQSRNAGVVMAVAQLFYHAGPVSDLPQAGKALVRLLRGPYEVQSVVLHSIASLTVGRKSMFEPYLKSFFVRTTEPTHIKMLKLEILSNLATESSVPVVLRELQTYVTASDKRFVAAAIQAIGRLASNIPEVTENCLNGLLHLLSSKDECVVAEAVIVMKRVVQSEGRGAGAAAARSARLLRRLAAPAARAAALWLQAEHGAHLPSAPAVLARFMETFGEEDELVKLQVMTLSVKLSLVQADTLPMALHVLNLARYDASYDVRDRARFLRKFLQREDQANGKKLPAHAKKIFLSEKPAPLMESKFKDRQQYTMGSLSHFVGSKAAGYSPLPPFPAEATPLTLRDLPEMPVSTDSKQDNKKNSKKQLLSLEESSSPFESSSSGDESSSSDYNTSSGKQKSKSNRVNSVSSSSSSSDSSSSSSSDSEDSSGSEEDSCGSSLSKGSSKSSGSESEAETGKPTAEKGEKGTSNETKTTSKEVKEQTEPSALKDATPAKSNLELLLELDEVASTLPTMTPSYAGFFSPLSATAVPADDNITPVSASYVDRTNKELLNRLSGHGLEATYHYTRTPHLLSAKLAALQITFTNHTQEDVINIVMAAKPPSAEQGIQDSPIIALLPAGISSNITLGVDFADTIKPVTYNIASSLGEEQVSIKPDVGELMRAVSMSESCWQAEQKKLRGMNQFEGVAALPGVAQTICQRVFKSANLAPITSQGSILRFAGQTLSTRCLVLVSVQVNKDDTKITVNCDNMAVGSLLLRNLQDAFTL